jgi:dTMP kinase
MANLKLLSGKFIVIDGTDGVGKSTQVDLLSKRLLKEGLNVGVFDFPQYGNRSASMVEDYLSGKYGRIEEVNPYVASIFYACDRFDAASEIKKALKDGKVVVANRYTSSNMGHQGAKISNKEERAIFWKWILDLEFEKMQLPKPDVVFILHVPAEIGATLASERRIKQQFLLNRPRLDIHEKDIEHLKKAEESYLELIEFLPNEFLKIECVRNEILLSPEDIHKILWDALVEKFCK